MTYFLIGYAIGASITLGACLRVVKGDEIPKYSAAIFLTCALWPVTAVAAITYRVMRFLFGPGRGEQ